MLTKISLGTAQFGDNYGIANKTGQVPKEQVFEILDFAKSEGIRYLDTASSYGTSEAVIGEYLRKNPDSFSVTSKLPLLKQGDSKNVEQYLKQSIEKLGVSKLDSYLLHRLDDIKSNDDLWNNIICLREDGLVEKIGVSLYYVDELKFLLDRNIDFDVIQVPYSVFDRRFAEYFEILKERNIVVQVRSVFLQGLIFLNSADLPEHLSGARSQLEKLHQLAESQNIPVEALALNFALLNPNVDQVLIGVDSLTQLKNNIRSSDFINNTRNILEQLNEIGIEQEEILVPSKWKLNTVQI